MCKSIRADEACLKFGRPITTTIMTTRTSDDNDNLAGWQHTFSLPYIFASSACMTAYSNSIQQGVYSCERMEQKHTNKAKITRNFISNIEK